MQPLNSAHKKGSDRLTEPVIYVGDHPRELADPAAQRFGDRHPVVNRNNNETF